MYRRFPLDRERQDVEGYHACSYCKFSFSTCTRLSRHERLSILCHQTEMTGAEETRKRRHEVDELDRQMLAAGKWARLDDPQLMGSGSLEGLVHKPHSLINNLNPSLDDMPDLLDTSSPVRTEARGSDGAGQRGTGP
jgi:hypothetical protein